jgi:branched-chain amino acid transport system substrate-binding protein
VPTAPSLIFFGGEYQVAAAARTAATNAGLNVPLMGGDGVKDPDYIVDAGEASAGSYASTVGLPIANLPGSERFQAAYAAAGFDADPTDFGPYAYDAANDIIAALRTALTGKRRLPANVRTLVREGIQDGSTTGVTGPISFDEFGDATAPTFTLYRVQGTPLAWEPVASS